MSITDNLKIFFQYILPKHFVSVLAGKLADVRTPWFKNLFISKFAKAYQIDMSNAIEPELTNYPCFNDFFTRAIHLDSRPINQDSESFCSPVDGAMSQFGAIESGKIVQAKNHHYSALELLGGNEEQAKWFENGEFCTIYLAPKDYHRIHMPCEGKLFEMAHVPGQLFSVNPLTAQNVPKLFARNERVVCFFETSFGKMALVAVGATIVGSIETAWAGNITPPSRTGVKRWQYQPDEVNLDKGEEMGRFKLGSTVVLLMENKNWQWDESVNLEADLKLGQKLVSAISTE
ncbi:MAG: phosphatidylserine decarboxylase [Kangiellaceae bacterium]|nr:phosphatidylserine decarboxylase [Kangiellaceae bacterium]